MIYLNLLDRLSVNEGMVAENVVAQTLTAVGDELYFYSRNGKQGDIERMEIDFLIRRENKICPVEVKSAAYQHHASLDKFRRRFGDRIGVATLLAKIAVEVTGQPHDEAAWLRFFELYEPAIRKFAEFQGAKADAEDIAQEILLKLVDVLRHGKYSATAGKFRCYLATLIRREVIDFWRRGEARAVDSQISLDNPDAGLDIPCDFDAGDELDLKWRLARHAAAVEHALTKTALSQRSKDIYRAYVLDEEPLKVVAKRFGVSENTVAQIKTRVNKMIAALEEGMA